MRELTREEVLAMVPGYDLDVLVAEKVMGWKVDGSHVNKNGYIAYMADFKASTDIKAALEIAIKLCERDDVKFSIDFGYSFKNKWNAGFQYNYSSYAGHTSPTIPEAIAKAALLAVLEATP